MESISYFDLETAISHLKSVFPSLQILSIMCTNDGMGIHTKQGDYMYSPITKKLYKVIAITA